MPRVLLLLLLLVVQAKPVWAGANAADVYRQVFELLEPLSDEEERLLKNGRASEPGDPAIKALLEKHAEALALFVKATALSECNWGLDYRRGRDLEYFHLKPMLLLAELLQLRAHQAIREGRSEAAVADYVAGLRASRHVASAGQTMLFEYSAQGTMEARVVLYLANDFSWLDEPALREISGHLESLPPRSTFSQVLEQERRVTIPWLRRQHAMGAPPSLGTRRALPATFLSLPVISNQVWNIDQLNDDYRTLIAILSLPPKEALALTPAFYAELKDKKWSRLLSRLVLSVIGDFYKYDLKHPTRFTMLKAAIALRLEGEEALSRFPDPYSGKLFEYRKTEGGFELKAPELPARNASNGVLEFR